MPDSVVQKIDHHLSKYPKRSYPKGQILIFANENPEHVYYLVKGKVRAYDVSYRGDEVIVNIFKPSAFFPMSWAVNRTPNKYFYKTEEPTELHVVPVEDAIEFIKDNPDVMLDLLSRVYRGLDGLLGRMVHLMSGSAKSRLMYELVIECRRFGKKLDSGNYSLNVSEVDLAARSGLSRETVNREINKLKTAGIITINGSGIVIKDLAQIEQKVGLEL